MSSRQPLKTGQPVKYREAAQVYPATVRGDLEDDIYYIDVDRRGKVTSSIPAHRLDIYSDEDLPFLIDDLFGVSEDALAEIHQLLQLGSNPIRAPLDQKTGTANPKE
ncbi:hypothetical protein Pan97_25010 [Bremerella volcania]|uniref:Uncharacterized protein n=1 Tax=Bremerella volcania TaxID=2527984 RepID=A0A518C8B7_9BACT|nr:hypothetical protein [Bremerella volcania]QDU75469.1 hypothetical protein Pan97_25010 [Bremerella volcania]